MTGAWLRAKLVLVLALGAVGASAAIVVGTVRRTHSPWEWKLARAERAVYYRVTAGGGPTFVPPAGDRVLQFATHALLPQGTRYDPRREVVYGLRFRLGRPGESTPTWERDVYLRSRQSKARFDGEHWLDESAFSLESAVELTDERSVDVTLPADAPPGATLSVRLLGGAPEALVRAYQRHTRTPLGETVFLARASGAAADALAHRVGDLPWEHRTEAERRALAGSFWERLSAVGEEGRTFGTRAVHETEFRLPPEGESASAEGEIVGALRAAAFNVRGPATVELVLARGDGGPPAPGEQVRVRAVSERGAAGPWAFDVPAVGARAVHALDLPSGVHTLAITTDGPGGARVSVHARPEALFGMVTAEAAGSEGAGAERVGVPVDGRRFTAYLLERGRAEAEFDVPDGLGDDARLFRVEVRALYATSAGAGGSTRVHFVFVDARGATVASGDVPLGGPNAAFERAYRADGTDGPVSEPARFHLVAPRAARQLRLSADDPAAARVLAFLPADTALRAPYADVEASQSVWRYAPHRLPAWLPVRALNDDALTAALATVQVRAQARLESLGAERSADAAVSSEPARTDPVALRPVGLPARQYVLDPVRAEERVAMLRRWPDGAYAALEGGLRVRGEAGPPRAPWVQYWLDEDAESALGADVELRVDGATVLRSALRATRGVWALPSPIRGAHEVELLAPRGVRALIDRAPERAAGVGLFEMRTVYALRGGAVRFEAATRAGAERVVDLVVYGPGRAADADVRLRVMVDGGAPARREGTAFRWITDADRAVALPAANRAERPAFADERGRAAGYPRVVALRLGDDLAPGRHTVEVRAEGRGSAALWVRAFSYTRVGAAPEAAVQWRARAPESVAIPDEEDEP